MSDTSNTNYMLTTTANLLNHLSKYGYVICQNMTERAFLIRALKGLDVEFIEDAEKGPLGGSEITLS